MISSFVHAIDNFIADYDDRPGVGLICGGWIHSSNDIIAITLEIPGTAPIPIDEFRLPSPDVATYAGPDANAARFRLERRIETDPDLTRARLRVAFSIGDSLSIDLGRVLTVNRHRPKAERDLVMRFEGLGDNCEFGLMQREVGFERLGLLRYAGARRSEALVEAIEHGFEGFATPDDLAMSDFGGEWVATSRRYGFTFHTRVFVAAMTEDAIRKAESTKLSFMAQMLMEDVETGHKVFVRRVDEGDREAGMWDLHRAIRARGPGRLLWVTAGEPGREHALVEPLGDGLYRGYHGRLSTYGHAGDFDADLWISLLRAAETAMAEHAAGQSAPTASPLQREAWWRRVLSPKKSRQREFA